MSYIFPSNTINHVLYTAKRWGQAPRISYIAGGTAGKEIVTLTTSLDDIIIKIEDGVSTNLQIVNAISRARDFAVDSLYASDLVSVMIQGGHANDINTVISNVSLIGAAIVLPPVSQPTYVSQSPVVQDDAREVVEMDATATIPAIYDALPEITTDSAVTQTESYVREDVQSIATLANDLKAGFNSIVSKYNQEALAALVELRASHDSMVLLSNELKAKYNSAILLINELKTKLDAVSGH
jgi:hypothetical protein